MSLTRTKIIVAMVSLLSLSAVTTSIASGSAGGSCTKAGLTTVANGQKFTCSLIWVASASKTIASPKTKKSTPGKIGIAQSKGFALISVQFSNDGLGDAQASARIANITNQTLTAIFGITIFASDGVTPLVTLEGSGDGIGSGETQTVQFVSTNGSLPSGQFKYAFQTTAQF